MKPESFKKIQYSFGFRPSLLIVDRSGVYSTARRRYIRKTHYHRYRAMAMDLAPIVKAYRSLQKLRMNSWPEHGEESREEITLWKHRVMDAYWDAAPEKRKASAMERYFRARYKHGMLYPLMACEVAVIVGARLLRLMITGRFQVLFDRLLLLLAFCLMSWFQVVMMERVVAARWTLSRSQIYNVLEFELRN
jgi:hypothetical protein